MTDRVSAAVIINCPPERLYRLVVDLPRMSEWSPESTGGRWLTGGGPIPGARFVGRNRAGRRRWTTLSTVTAAETSRRFAFRVTAPLVPIASWEYVIEAVNGGCRVEETWVDLRPAPVKLISTIRTGIADRGTFTQRSIEQTLARLKTAAESDAAA
jgi:uncharacterized protein YndB with AHSA1/START domain